MYNKNYNNKYSNNTYHNEPNKKPEEKKLRYGNDTLTKEKNGKTIKLTFTNGTTMSGVLKDFGMYDLLLKTGDKELIIFKAHILFVEVL